MFTSRSRARGGSRGKVTLGSPRPRSAPMSQWMVGEGRALAHGPSRRAASARSHELGLSPHPSQPPRGGRCSRKRLQTHPLPSKSTSPTRRDLAVTGSCTLVIPTSMTAAPSLIMSAVMRLGMPAGSRQNRTLGGAQQPPAPPQPSPGPSAPSCLPNPSAP